MLHGCLQILKYSGKQETKKIISRRIDNKKERKQLVNKDK